MKLNKMFLVSIFILAILVIGAASASEEISDDVAAIEPTDDVITESVDEIEPTDEAPVQAVEEEDIQDSTILGDVEDDIKNDFEVQISDQPSSEGIFIYVQTKSDTYRSGNLSFFVNDVEKYKAPVYGGYIYDDERSWYFSADDLELASGTCAIKVNFFDDDEQKEVTLANKTITYISCVIPMSNQVKSAEEIITYLVKFPNVSSGTMTITDFYYGNSSSDMLNKTLGTANIVNEMATLEISGLNPNSPHMLLIEFSTNLGYGNRTAYMTIFNNTGNVAVSVPTEIVQGNNAIVSISSNESSPITISVDGNEVIYMNVSSLKYIIPDLSVGTHIVRVIYGILPFGSSSSLPESFYSNSYKITVKKPAPAPTPAPTVKKLATKIVASKKTFKVKTKVKKYTITLKAGKKLVKKVKVTLKVKGKTYKATTNSKGKATFKIKNLKKKGKYTAAIKFAGNKNYKASSKKVKLTVKK